MNVKEVKAYGTEAAVAPLKPLTIQRRHTHDNDVEIDILFCGVCHSDLHTARNEWHNAVYPVVPGHEIIGRVSNVGKAVKNFKTGDLAAIGCMVDSCKECAHCREGLEQYCEKGSILTYNSPDIHSGRQTYGGYSESIVVREDFVLRVPENLDPAATAPLLCAGITTYSPLKHWQAGPGKRVGIVGIGGLGHMGIKIEKAMGAHVVVFTTSESKILDAKGLGADEVVMSKDTAQMEKYAGSLHLIVDTVSAWHDVNVYLQLLKVDGTMVLVGAPEHQLQFSAFSVIPYRKSFAGSMIGGIAETQEMLDFCSKHNITADIELIHIKQINEAYERLLNSDVKYRFVIDMASLK